MCDSSGSKYFCVFCPKDVSIEGNSSSAIKSPSPTAAKLPPPANTYNRPSKEVISKLMSHFEASHTYHPINYIRDRSVTLGLSSREFKYYNRFNDRLADIQKDDSKDSNQGFKVPKSPAPKPLKAAQAKRKVLAKARKEATQAKKEAAKAKRKASTQAKRRLVSAA